MSRNSKSVPNGVRLLALSEGRARGIPTASRNHPSDGVGNGQVVNLAMVPNNSPIDAPAIDFVFLDNDVGGARGIDTAQSQNQEYRMDEQEFLRKLAS